MGIDVYKDIEAAIKLINGDYRNIDRNIYSPVYPWTNERIKDYMKHISLDGSKVLTVTSSFDHGLNAIGGGATEIDCFDKNRLSKYYADLKQAIMLCYSEGELESFIPFKPNTSSIKPFSLNPGFSLSYLRMNFVMDESYLFWKNVLNCPTFYTGNYRLFRNDGFPHYDFENYDELKQKLSSATISFKDLDIQEISRSSKKYDAMILSNVLEHINDPTILTRLYDMLNENGIILEYCFSDKKRVCDIEPDTIISCPFTEDSDYKSQLSQTRICKVYRKQKN